MKLLSLLITTLLFSVGVLNNTVENTENISDENVELCETNSTEDCETSSIENAETTSPILLFETEKMSLRDCIPGNPSTYPPGEGCCYKGAWIPEGHRWYLRFCLN